ncbi:MFS transporter [Laceyella sacchari]|uniref:MFS transporter n=1 Tax=Laceyella sacchari TaxID=37482 RepID=A0ABY5U3R8_LACSH|nr:MFS transporter [Laceyella sacchari]UWE04281.1 MFS transporter [Laceyella sacchari]
MEHSKSGSAFILYLVCISAFFASLNQNIYSPIIPLIRDSFHVSVSMVNASVSMFIFITAIMQIVLGSAVDFKGAKFVLIPGIILTVIASIGCAVTQHFTLFLVFRALQAIGTAAIPLIAATTIGHLFKGSQRGSAMGTYQMLLSVAPVIAPVLGGFIGDQYSYPGVFWFLAGISVILLLTNAFYFPQDHVDKKKEMNLSTWFSHYKTIFNSKAGNAILILSFFIFFIYFSIIVYLPILLTDHFHLSLKIVGLLYLPVAVSTMAGSMIFKYIQSSIPLKKLFTIGNIMMAFSMLLFSFTHSLSLIAISIALVLHGISVGLITPLYSTMITNEFEQQKGSAIGMFNFVRYIGMAAGPIISGLLLAEYTSKLVFGLLGVLFALLSFFLGSKGLNSAKKKLKVRD